MCEATFLDQGKALFAFAPLVSQIKKTLQIDENHEKRTLWTLFWTLMKSGFISIYRYGKWIEWIRIENCGFLIYNRFCISLSKWRCEP